MNRYERSLLAKFRCGILQLKIETGRFNQTKLEDRLCDICNNDEIEDEYHFLCNCAKYSSLRASLFRKVSDHHECFVALDMRQKFVFLLSKCNRDVAKFIRKAWEERKKFLYK